LTSTKKYVNSPENLVSIKSKAVTHHEDLSPKEKDVPSEEGTVTPRKEMSTPRRETRKRIFTVQKRNFTRQRIRITPWARTQIERYTPKRRGLLLGDRADEGLIAEGTLSREEEALGLSEIVRHHSGEEDTPS